MLRPTLSVPTIARLANAIEIAIASHPATLTPLTLLPEQSRLDQLLTVLPAMISQVSVPELKTSILNGPSQISSSVHRPQVLAEMLTRQALMPVQLHPVQPAMLVLPPLLPVAMPVQLNPVHPATLPRLALVPVQLHAHQTLFIGTIRVASQFLNSGPSPCTSTSQQVQGES